MGARRRPRPPPTRTALALTALPDALAELIVIGYHDYRHRFAEVTRRAWRRFENREWEDAQEDARERILLYDVVVAETLLAARRRLGRPAPSRDAAVAARGAFRAWSRERPDCEIAQTFFNSVLRRLLGTVGADREVEFVASAVDEPDPSPARPWRSWPLEAGFAPALEATLTALPFEKPWHERTARCRAAARILAGELGPEAVWREGSLEMLRTPFFRNKAAYLVGRAVRRAETRPVILALTHPPEGITLDAVLPTEDEASVVFGFTRSYLHADLGAPRPAIEFLRGIMPRKRTDELYTVLGFNRHGKTELYRTLLEHLALPGARFERTPGTEGLVMAVFTLPELNVVFKVIRDRFGHPKKTTRERVKRNYGLIFVRDRVGRLADAQAFEHMELPRDRFSDDVLAELLDTAARTVSADHDTVVIEHLYTERRVHPLDLYLAEAGPDDARHAVLDFGQAIKDLAAADIFPGDMLVKNFGVTRHGRVIFYDYDEVVLLTDCRFRDKPRPAYPEAELAAEPDYYVAPEDVFPAEWRPFLGPSGPLREIFQEAHGELFDPAWWRDMQRRQRAGEVVDFFPYEKERRLDPSTRP
ncbi:MAG TPA: bifunctional isocitrate dehydrogenase kinase/phosphatase [Longimicrobiales bacterium]|nr:bifunctional isocitrate dehydrogenase kinase/phosphatase [Longimicrobiales bacterium]